MPETAVPEQQYIRIGENYFQKRLRLNGHQIMGIALQPVLKGEVKRVIGHTSVEAFEGFAVVPDHQNYQRYIGSNYNLYEPLPWNPTEGIWPAIKTILEHTFQDRIEIGLDYLQLLYQQPTQLLPVLVICGHRCSGKTTFQKLLASIFCGNAAFVPQRDLGCDFNQHWASKLLLAMEEVVLNRSTIERIKDLSTASQIMLNAKGQAMVSLPFYGKLVLSLNHAPDFMSDEYHRFWFVEQPPLADPDPWIHDLAVQEIPAFLHFLNSRKMSTEKESRIWFNPSLLK
jgi:hypothetical protein